MLNYRSTLNQYFAYYSALLFFTFISITALPSQAQDNLKDAELRRNNERATDLIKNAKAEAKKERYDAAIDFATRALEYSASKEYAYFERAKIYAAKKDYENAVKDYTECIKLGEHQPLYYSARAGVYLAMKKYTDAVTDLTEVIRLNPQSTSGY